MLKSVKPHRFDGCCVSGEHGQDKNISSLTWQSYITGIIKLYYSLILQATIKNIIYNVNEMIVIAVYQITY